MKTPRTDVAFDKGYAAGFHFGMDAEHNPYKQYSKYHAWELGLYIGKQDKVKSRQILAAYNGGN